MLTSIPDGILAQAIVRHANRIAVRDRDGEVLLRSACWRIGAIAVPVRTETTRNQLAHLVVDAEPVLRCTTLTANGKVDRRRLLAQAEKRFA